MILNMEKENIFLTLKTQNTLTFIMADSLMDKLVNIKLL